MNSTNSTNSINSKTRFLHLLPISLLALSFFWAYFDTLVRLVKSWANYDQAHTAILLAISLYLLWTERTALKQLSPRPSIIAGTVVVLLGCIILIGGKLSNTLLLQYTSLPITISGIIMLIGGSPYIRVVWLPITYLFFVFGLVDEILGNMNIYLQHAAAWTASGLLKTIGMPVVLKGLILELPHISLEVEKGCSGQKHIIALLALAVPIVYLRLHGLLPRFLLIATAFLIGIFGNGIRIAIIGLWSINHPRSIHGPHDIFYVSFIFFFGIILFLFVIWIAESFWPKKRNKKNVINPGLSQHSTGLTTHSFSAPFAFGIVLLCGVALFIQVWQTNQVILQNPLERFPPIIGDWSGQDIVESDSPLKHAKPDLLLYRKYVNSMGKQIQLSIAYFESQNENKRIIGYQTDWLYSHEIRTLSLSGNNIGKTFRNNEKRELETVYFWFDIDGKTTAGRYMAKIKTIISACIKRQTNGSITVISFPQKQAISDSEQNLFIQQAFPLIQDFLKQTIVI